MTNFVEAECMIRQLHARYADSVWRQDFETFGECFAEDCEWRIGGAILKGRQKIVDYNRELFTTKFRKLFITLRTPVLEVGDGVASGRTYFSAQNIMADGSAFAPILAVDAAEWMNVIEVNLLGPLLTVKHAGQRLTDGGSIIVTASLNAVQAAGGMSAYCCSKAALAMLAEVAAMELGPRRIRVNSIGPGLVRTPLTEAMWLLPQLVTEFDENAPVATHTSPDDVANLVTFLASDESASISGQLHLVDRAAHTKRYPDMLGLLS